MKTKKELRDQYLNDLVKERDALKAESMKARLYVSQQEYNKVEKERDALKAENEFLIRRIQIDGLNEMARDYDKDKKLEEMTANHEFMRNEYDDLARDTEHTRELLKDENQKLREELEDANNAITIHIDARNDAMKRVIALRLALNEVHQVVQNRQHEGHMSLTSYPVQNGCLVYTEWKIKAIKERALAADSLHDEGV